MAKYEARHIRDDQYIVYKRRWFGWLPPLSRIAIWDGCDFNYSSSHSSSKPDWYWENSNGKSSAVMVRHRARRALVKEFMRIKGRVPNDWSTGVPMARLLEGAME